MVGNSEQYCQLRFYSHQFFLLQYKEPQWLSYLPVVLILFQMSVTQLWIPAAFLSILMLQSASSQMCEMPLKAAFMQITDTTFPADSKQLDSDLTYYRQVLKFTEDEIDREREAAIRYFNRTFGLDFSNIEPDEQGQRVLGNATFRPVVFPYNATLVYNRWLVNGNSKSRCYKMGDGGFQVAFNGSVRLGGEFGGSEEKYGFAHESVLYGRDYIYDACAQQGILLQTESMSPIRVVDGWIILAFRIRNRQLGEGMTWGVSRVTPVNPTTLRYESRQVYSFV